MTREFELHKEVDLDATPEQVWDAIATGPGISSWFMGPYEVEPHVGGRIRLTIGDFSEASTITAWDPGKRLACQGGRGPDGSFHAMEYVIEGREGGSTVLRFVHSGILSDDWGAEYEDMTGHGWDMYLHTLGQYLTHFTGRPGAYVYAAGPKAPDGRDGWSLLVKGLGLTEPIARGDRVRLTPEGVTPVDGVVDYATPGFREFLGVRGNEGLYRFHGGGESIAVGHHVFAEGVDAAEAAAAWQAWLNQVLIG